MGYVGQTDKAGSVLALMQVLVGDFANLQAETEAAEQLALKQYTALVSDLTTDRKLAEQQSDQAEERVAALKQKVTEDTRDFELVEDKKLAHERFQVTLEQQCVDKGSSFEERQQKRREEKVTPGGLRNSRSLSELKAWLQHSLRTAYIP